jgi:ketosteroid isomerase-like protein
LAWKAAVADTARAMSEENVEVAKALFPAPWDMTALFATPKALNAARAQFEPLVQPDFVTVHDPKAIALGVGTPTGDGISEGIDGFIAIWRDYLSAWESWVVTATDFVDVDDERVLVLMTFGGRSKTHGVELTLDGANLLTLRDGKLARLALFFQRKDALEAAGLSE